MSQKAAHITQAKHNEQVARDMITSPLSHRDWSVVAVFYSSVHYLEASWADWGVHSRNHAERAESIKKLYSRNNYLKINSRILQDQGWMARYLSEDSQNMEVAQQFFDQDSISKLFERLEGIKNNLRIDR